MTFRDSMRKDQPPSLMDRRAALRRAAASTHTLSQEPQPIADQVMVKCSCGWREAVSLWTHHTVAGVQAEIHRVGQEHLLDNSLDSAPRTPGATAAR